MRRKIFLALGSCTLLGTAGTVAFAADATEEVSGALEEIVVTAQKREQSINTVPISITAVTGENLAASGILDTASLTRVVPGFMVSNTYFGSPVYYLRGVGFYDTALAAKPAVSMYSDEAPIPFAIMGMGNLLDVERVEVLKGPQGTFFGQNSTGGAINFISAKPTDEFTWGSSLSFGRFSDVSATGFLSGPLGAGFSTRLAASTRHASDWQHGYTNSATNGSVNTSSLRWILEWSPDEAPLTAELTVAGSQDKSDVQAPQLVGKVPMTLILPVFAAYPLAPLNDARAADFSSRFPDGESLQRDDWTWRTSLRFDYDISEALTLTSLTSFSKAERSNGYDTDGATLSVANLTLTGDVQSFSQELRLAGKAERGMSWVVGANYEDNDSHELVTFLIDQGRSGQVFNNQGLPPTDLVPQVTDQGTKSTAGFANLEFDLAEAWRLAAGVRYTKTSTDFAACALAGGNLSYATGISRVLGLPTPASGTCATFAPLPAGGYRAGLVTNSLDEDNVSWRASLDWTPREGAMFYGAVSRGYKGGSFSNISAVFATQYTPVPQEELTAYEIGAKAELIPDKLRLNAAAFYYDYKDKQLLGTVSVPVFISLTALVSIPESHVQGGEFELIYQPVKDFRLNLGGTYVQTRVDGSITRNTVFGAAVDFGGSQFPDTPKWQGNGGAEYAWSIGSGRKLFLGTQFVYRDVSYADFIRDSRIKVDAYTLWDAQIGVRSDDGRWQAHLWGKNLADEVYANTIVRRQEALVRSTGMPRTYGVYFSYRP